MIGDLEEIIYGKIARKTAVSLWIV